VRGATYHAARTLPWRNVQRWWGAGRVAFGVIIWLEMWGNGAGNDLLVFSRGFNQGRRRGIEYCRSGRRQAEKRGRQLESANGVSLCDRPIGPEGQPTRTRGLRRGVLFCMELYRCLWCVGGAVFEYYFLSGAGNSLIRNTGYFLPVRK